MCELCRRRDLVGAEEVVGQTFTVTAATTPYRLVIANAHGARFEVRRDPIYENVLLEPLDSPGGEAEGEAVDASAGA